MNGRTKLKTTRNGESLPFSAVIRHYAHRKRRNDGEPSLERRKMKEKWERKKEQGRRVKGREVSARKKWKGREKRV